MSRKAFYGTRQDILDLIQFIESNYNYKFQKTGLLNADEVYEIDSLIDFPKIGIVESGDSLQCEKFIVFDQDNKIKVREVQQSKGGVKFAIDQLINPDTITFLPGGELEVSNIVIEGTISTASNSIKSKEIFNIFFKCLKKMFKKHENVYLGKQANDFLNNGWRLTNSVYRPNEYDISKTSL